MHERLAEGARVGQWLALGAVALLPACIISIVDPEGSDSGGDSGVGNGTDGGEEEEEEVQVYTLLDTPEELVDPSLDIKSIVATDHGFYFHVDALGRSYVGKIPYSSDASCADWCYLRGFDDGELVLGIDASREADGVFEPLMVYSGAGGLTHVELDDLELNRSATAKSLNTAAILRNEYSQIFAASDSQTFVHDPKYQGPDAWRPVFALGASVMTGGRNRVYGYVGTLLIEITSDSNVTTYDFADPDHPLMFVDQIVPDGDEAWAIVGTWLYRREADGWRGVLDITENVASAGVGTFRIAVDETFVYLPYGKAYNKNTGDLCRWLSPPARDDLESLAVVVQAYAIGTFAVGGGFAFIKLPFGPERPTFQFVALQLRHFGEPFCEPWTSLF